MMPVCRRVAVLLIFVSLCGCGNPGSPLPPSLMLPEPVVDLSGARTGDTVALHWTMTRRTTDRVVLKGDQRVLVCRAVGAGACERAGELLVEAGKPAAFSDALPAALRAGPLRLLRYEVRLKNHAGRDAGASNAVFTAAGWAPPAVGAASAEVTAKGVEVRWQARAAGTEQPGARLLARVERNRVLRPGESERAGKEEVQAGVPQPMEQTLEAPEHWSADAWTPDHTLDANAVLNRSYRYMVRLVEQVRLDGRAVEISGEPGQTGVMAARDVFPPGVPSGLAAVANAEGGSIDLAWNADAEPDVAGYVVYRRVDGGAPERVSGGAPVKSPDWSDTKAAKGVRYRYSVAAVDASGNESGRSAEVVEGLP